MGTGLHADVAGSVGDTGVTVVIVNYRTPDLAIACLDALAGERARLPRLDAVLVDGGSADGANDRLAAAVAEAGEWARFLPLPINGGFGWANNQAMLEALQRAEPPAFIHLLNPDARVEPGAVANLVAFMQANPRCGAVGSQLLDPAGPPHASAFRFPRIRSELARGAEIHGLLRLTRTPDPVMPQGSAAFETDWVPGASVMLRAEALRQAGLFDDGFFLYFEEVELMWRIRRAGWSIWAEPASRVVHVAGASTGVQVDGSAKAAAARPAYWYRSQRRAMVRMLGAVRGYAGFATWLAGRALGGVREGLARGGRSNRPPGEVRAMLGAWLRPAADRAGGPVDWQSTPGTPPAWMRER